MKPRLLFLTSSNLASNPRCRKEIDLALQQKYHVTYIAFNLNNWTNEKEELIQIELEEVEKIYISAGKDKLISWAISSFLEILLRKIHKYISSVSLISYAVNKRSLQLVWALKKLKVRPDVVIAHNPATFYPAYLVAKKLKVPFALDIEDYHPGEGSNRKLKELNLRLLRKIMPAATYSSFAAPLIKQKVLSDIFPQTVICPITVNNVFPQNEFEAPLRSFFFKLKLVWFSQNIDFNRGLENLIPVIAELEEICELTLIGNIGDAFAQYLKPYNKLVKIVPPLPQNELHRRLKEFDVGLAIEPGKDLNNNLAVSNKIWSYFQAGLFIITSNTPAQVGFLRELKRHGVVVNLFDKKKLYQEILKVYQGLEKISSERLERFETAKFYSWEKESELLKEKWEEILS